MKYISYFNFMYIFGYIILLKESNGFKIRIFITIALVQCYP